MPYRIEFETAARRQLRRLPLEIQDAIGQTIDPLMDDPRPRGVKKLSVGRNLYRIRVGVYRVIYRIDDDTRTITVKVVDHRSDAYR